MTASTSRAPSARPASAARNIQRRREKPYKTEQSRIVARKRKLDLHTTYTKAPDGFQFLPVGTPDLAERCKELSRQRGLPVNVVNAKPVSKHAADPEKVSHHIHRIGYHFRSDVVDDACQELGYVHSHGNFIKESDLAAQNEDSKLARTMARFGIAWNKPLEQETNEKVRAAIKELFPRIPEDDLKAILEHAWAEGTQRVGTNSTIELPRRVQLATIARIRHTYTDYDRLLRAFEWKEARSLVEPTCLKKLIEWRGENEDEDDNELEEIVRETIVIDDDDDDPRPRRGSEADNESAADIDQGYASDTSLEISHKPAAIEDLGAESHDERSRRFLNRHQPQPQFRNVQQRYMDVREKIGLVRQQLRNAPVHEPNIVRVHVPQSPNDDGAIMIGGQMFRRAPLPVAGQQSPVYYAPLQPPPGHTPVYHQPVPTSYPPQQMSPRRAGLPTSHTPHDQPIASIEPQDDLRRKGITSAVAQPSDARSNGHRSRPGSPAHDTNGKRRRLDSYSQGGRTVEPRSQYSSPSNRSNGQPVGSSNAVPATRVYANGHPRPQSASRGSPFADRVVPRHEQPQAMSYGAPLPVARYEVHTQPTRPDPRPDHRTNGVDSHAVTQHGFVDAQVAPIQYVPISRQYSLPRPPPGRYYAQGYPGGAPPGAQVVYVEQPRPGYMQPQPVHGAPAAVQPAPVTVSTGYAPAAAKYAPQPQYYYPAG
ncbi:hypothetical protein Slin15195_G003410 [Septoria linicola]|uniref:DUF2293 domain-containing protein n=1 Tax=Septoria linicola TaxID=215465 RepID=A0A9Q9AJ34_9PEZI|nr:hypothetical protein Slin14017_G003440 [Septoria linicola]USW47022.1 hypothetical protein Slin15195_G003410 [Septoria linicola]